MVILLEFEEKQFNGNYEVIQVDIENKGEIFKGLLYLPSLTSEKPYPLVIYFHGFPQIFPLQEIVKNYKFILDMGYAFLLFNFRGYRYSDGNISIEGQYSDAEKIIEFTQKLAIKGIFDLKTINIIAHDFGAYIALILCSKNSLIKNLLLISPLLNIERHVNSPNFKEALAYINRFLPGNIRGIENIESFIEGTKNEILLKDFQIGNIITNLKNKNLKIIIGEIDKFTPISEVDYIQQKSNILCEVAIIKGMDHNCIEDEEIEEINKEIEQFFSKNNGNKNFGIKK